MKHELQFAESEIRRKSQELAVAWCRGRSTYVLDTLSAEPPLTASLLATLVYEALARWDPYDCKWPNRFWQALLHRSEGLVTGEELVELETEYRRRFGSSPPGAEALPAAHERSEDSALLSARARRLRQAIASGRPIERQPAEPSPYLRTHTVRQTQEEARE